MISLTLNFLICKTKPLTTKAISISTCESPNFPLVYSEKPSDLLQAYNNQYFLNSANISNHHLIHSKRPNGVPIYIFLNHTCRWPHLNDLQNSPPGKNPRGI